MDALTDSQLAGTAVSADEEAPRWSRLLASWPGALSPRRIGAIYVWGVIIVVFGVLKPHLFLATQTASGIADSYAVTGIAALALLVPLSAGAFDVSVGANMSLVSVVVSQLLLTTSMPVPVVVLLGLAIGLGVGALNSVIV